MELSKLRKRNGFLSFQSNAGDIRTVAEIELLKVGAFIGDFIDSFIVQLGVSSEVENLQFGVEEGGEGFVVEEGAI